MKITVKAIANAKNSEIFPIIDENSDILYKVKICQKAQDGKANEAIIEALSVYFCVKKSCIKLLLGAKNSNKVFEIEGL